MYSFDLDQDYGNERYRQMVQIGEARRNFTDTPLNRGKSRERLLKKVSQQLRGLQIQLRSAQET